MIPRKFQILPAEIVKFLTDVIKPIHNWGTREVLWEFKGATHFPTDYFGNILNRWVSSVWHQRLPIKKLDISKKKRIKGLNWAITKPLPCVLGHTLFLKLANVFKTEICNTFDLSMKLELILFNVMLLLTKDLIVKRLSYWPGTRSYPLLKMFSTCST